MDFPGSPACRSLAVLQADEFEQALEVVVAVVFDFDFALFGGMLDGDVGGEVFAKTVGDGADVDVEFA